MPSVHLRVFLLAVLCADNTWATEKMAETEVVEVFLNLLEKNKDKSFAGYVVSQGKAHSVAYGKLALDLPKSQVRMDYTDLAGAGYALFWEKAKLTRYLLEGEKVLKKDPPRSSYFSKMVDRSFQAFFRGMTLSQDAKKLSEVGEWSMSYQNNLKYITLALPYLKEKFSFTIAARDDGALHTVSFEAPSGEAAYFKVVQEATSSGNLKPKE